MTSGGDWIIRRSLDVRLIVCCGMDKSLHPAVLAKESHVSS